MFQRTLSHRHRSSGVGTLPTELDSAQTLVAGPAQHPAPDVMITGGVAGDGSAFCSPWVPDGATPRSNILCAAGFHGKHVQVGRGSAGRVGFLSYGEISPALGQGASELRKRTMTATPLSEARAVA
jgi:hypothetical protein